MAEIKSRHLLFSIIHLFKLSVPCRQQLAVAQCIVYSCHIYPELVLSYAFYRVCGFRTCIWVFPFAFHYLIFRMRSVLQYIVFGRTSAEAIPFFTSSISFHMLSIVSTKLSSSARLSLSVGSIISVPCTGNERVGA